ncbi:MAG: type II toxin-antitoxin system PemK/MazF family toxin [Planctomycetes bacterium]|nr:type II toxin-antitoxin system PemK/MazF family toxin [Planctomycetota bacterium]
MPVDCVINRDNLHTIPKDRLRERLTTVPEGRLFALTQALRYSLELEW